VCTPSDSQTEDGSGKGAVGEVAGDW